MLVHTAGLAVAGSMAGASISEMGIFIGPALLKIKIRGLAFRLNLLPIGSYVKFESVESGSRPAIEVKLLQDLHPLTRAVIAGAGCVALLLVAAICLGPAAAFRHTVSGFPQIIMGTLSPTVSGARLLQLLYEFVSTGSFLATLGLVASKVTAFNLLPFPTLNGGDIILNLAATVKRLPDSLKEKLNTFGLLLMLGIWGSWLVALVCFLWR